MTREDAEGIIEAEKQNQSALAGVTTVSKVGVWTQIRFVFSALTELFWAEFVSWRTEVEGLAATRPWATTGWYIERAKLFQLGDVLVISEDGTYGYAEFDESKQIIKQAAIDVVDRELRLKVAAYENGELVKVPDDVMLSFKPYFEQIKRPGTIVRYVNAEADLLRLALRVWFDGELVESDVKAAIQTAISEYLQTIVFNGVFSVTKLIDTVQLVPGAVEVEWLSGTARSYGQDIADAVGISSRHKAASGYYKIEVIDDVPQLEIELIREP